METDERALFVGLWEQLKRIADALDRAYPIPRPYLPSEPAGLEALTVVTPALREKWRKEEQDRLATSPEVDSKSRAPLGR